jgi:hypothetical protein
MVLTLNKILPTHLQAHCQNSTSQSTDQSFVRAIKADTKENEILITAPHQDIKTNDIMQKRHTNHDRMKSTGGNTCFVNMAVQSSADIFSVNQSCFSVLTFMVKIASFAKPQTIIRNNTKKNNEQD